MYLLCLCNLKVACFLFFLVLVCGRFFGLDFFLSKAEDLFKNFAGKSILQCQTSSVGC